MYEPFPGNYVWNLSINLALCMGGSIGEMETANARIRAAAFRATSSADWT